MPEPVTCHAPKPGSTIMECDDIPIGPEPPETQQVEVHEGAAGARALADRTLPSLVVRSVETVDAPIDLPIESVTRECAAELIGVGLGVAAMRANPTIGTIATLKASIDLWNCSVETITEAQKDANEARAIELCEEKGGTPIVVVEGSVTCERAAPAVAR